MAVNVNGVKRLIDDMVGSLGGERIDCPEDVLAAEFTLLHVACCRYPGTLEEAMQRWDSYPLVRQPTTVRLEPNDEWRVHTHSGHHMRSYYVGTEEPGLGMDSPMQSADVFIDEDRFDDGVFVSVRLF